MSRARRVAQLRCINQESIVLCRWKSVPEVSVVYLGRVAGHHTYMRYMQALRRRGWQRPSVAIHYLVGSCTASMLMQVTSLGGKPHSRQWAGNSDI